MDRTVGIIERDKDSHIAQAIDGKFKWVWLEKTVKIKGKEQSFFSNNFILLNHKQICFITIYDGCLT